SARQSLRDLFVPRQSLLVLGRGDDGHPLVAAFGSKADIGELHAIGFARQPFPVGFELRVVGGAVIVADVKAESFFRRGDAARGLGVKERAQAGGAQEKGGHTMSHVRALYRKDPCCTAAERFRERVPWKKRVGPRPSLDRHPSFSIRSTDLSVAL